MEAEQRPLTLSFLSKLVDSGDEATVLPPQCVVSMQINALRCRPADEFA